MRSPDRTLYLPMPSRCDVLVYFSETKHCWCVRVVINAIDVDDPEAKTGEFGLVWDFPEEPTQEQIRVAIIDFLDHEVQHWLGMDPHAAEREPVARVVVQPRVHTEDVTHVVDAESAFLQTGRTAYADVVDLPPTVPRSLSDKQIEDLQAEYAKTLRYENIRDAIHEWMSNAVDTETLERGAWHLAEEDLDKIIAAAGGTI